MRHMFWGKMIKLILKAKANKFLLVLFCFSTVAIVRAETEFVYDSKSRRDPFLPLVSKEGYLINREAEVVPSEMNLEGIIFDESGKSLSIINGMVLKEGDKISSYTITKIEKQKVILQGDEEFILELREEK